MPLQEEQQLDSSEVKNYLELFVAEIAQMTSGISSLASHDLLPVLQSAYWAYYLTEKASTGVLLDRLLALYSGNAAARPY